MEDSAIPRLWSASQVLPPLHSSKAAGFSSEMICNEDVIFEDRTCYTHSPTDEIRCISIDRASFGVELGRFEPLPYDRITSYAACTPLNSPPLLLTGHQSSLIRLRSGNDSGSIFKTGFSGHVLRMQTSSSPDPGGRTLVSCVGIIGKRQLALRTFWLDRQFRHSWSLDSIGSSIPLSSAITCLHSWPVAKASAVVTVVGNVLGQILTVITDVSRDNSRTTHLLTKHVSPVTAVVWSGEQLISAARDSIIVVWSAWPKLDTPVKVIPVFGEIECLLFDNSDGLHIFGGCRTGRIRVWKFEPSNQTLTELRLQSGLRSNMLSSAVSQLYIVDSDLISLQCDLLVRSSIEGYDDKSVAVSSDEASLMTLNDHSVTSLAILFTVDSHRLSVTGCCYGDDVYILMSTFDSGPISYNLQSIIPTQHQMAIQGLTSSGSTVASAGGDLVIVWQLVKLQSYTLQPTHLCSGHASAVRTCSLFRLGSDLVSLLTADCDGILKLWQFSHADPIPNQKDAGPINLTAQQTVVGHQGHEVNHVVSVLVPTKRIIPSKEGRRGLDSEACAIVTASQDKTVGVHVVVIETGSLTGVKQTIKHVHSMAGHRRGITCLAISPADPCIVVSGSQDKNIRMWNMSTGSCARTFEGHTSSVSQLVFTSAQSLTSVDIDGSLAVWDLQMASAKRGLFALTSSASSSDQGQVVATTPSKHASIYRMASIVDSLGGEQQAIRSSGEVLAITVSRYGQTSTCVWADNADLIERMKQEARAVQIQSEQKLDNLVADGLLKEAVAMCIDLDRPRQLYQLLAAVDSDESRVQILDDIISESFEGRWSESQRQRLIDYIVRWNSNSKTCWLAQTWLSLIFSRPSTFSLIETKAEDDDGMPKSKKSWSRLELMTLVAYTERHMARYDKLYNRLAIVDVLLANKS